LVKRRTVNFRQNLREMICFEGFYAKKTAQTFFVCFYGKFVRKRPKEKTVCHLVKTMTVKKYFGKFCSKKTLK